MLKTVAESQAYFNADTFATETCGIVIDEVTEHGAVCTMPLGSSLMNAGGTAQGGAIFTLCDTVFAVAANAGGVLTVSQSASVSFMKPARGSRLRAVAEEMGVGRQTCVYTVRVFDDQNTLIACATVNGFRKQTRQV